MILKLSVKTILHLSKLFICLNTRGVQGSVNKAQKVRNITYLLAPINVFLTKKWGLRRNCILLMAK